MPPLTPCPNCKSMNWIPNPDIMSLLRIQKIEEGIAVDATKVFPVRVWVCMKCGYVTLYREEPR